MLVLGEVVGAVLVVGLVLVVGAVIHSFQLKQTIYKS